MPLRDDTSTQHQLKRWTLPDAHRFVRADWRRFVRPGHERELPFELYERKYSSDQPRVPSGNPSGGQWTSAAGANPFSASLATRRIDRVVTSGFGPRTKIAARISPERQLECERQYQLDSEICRIVGTRSCWGQAEFRLGQCLSGGYIPKLYH